MALYCLTSSGSGLQTTKMSLQDTEDDLTSGTGDDEGTGAEWTSDDLGSDYEDEASDEESGSGWVDVIETGSGDFDVTTGDDFASWAEALQEEDEEEDEAAEDDEEEEDEEEFDELLNAESLGWWDDIKEKAEEAKTSVENAASNATSAIKSHTLGWWDSAEDAAEEAKAEAESAAEEAKDKAESAKEKAEELADEASSKAEDVADEASSKAEEGADEAE